MSCCESDHGHLTDITIKQFLLHGADSLGSPFVLMCVSGAVQVGVVPRGIWARVPVQRSTLMEVVLMESAKSINLS